MLFPARRLVTRRRYPGLDPVKLGAIDFAFQEYDYRSFADLGGVWAVDGGYSCYAADLYGVERAVVVDEALTDELHRRAQRLPQLELLRGTFGSQSTAEALGIVDVVLLFDVLLHQVRPDWYEILELYAPRTRCFVIVQPQWNGTETVRLLDLGSEEYLRSVPSEDSEVYTGLTERLDEVNPQRDRLWRDVHDIWQWGIVDDDLIARMSSLGYRCRMRENVGTWRGLTRLHKRFHKGVFVFTASTG